MTPKVREFHRPADIAAAAALLRREAPITAPAAVGPRVPDASLGDTEALVDLRHLGLDFITQSDAGVVRLGAAVSLQSLVDSNLTRSLAGGLLAEAAALAGGSAMRNAATVGGALHYAKQAAEGDQRDGPPELLVALMALDAEVVMQAEARTAVPLAEYLAQGGQAARCSLLLEVRFARPGAQAYAALARVARTPRDQGLVAVAALVDGPAVRLAVAAGGSPPVRLTGLEHGLAGQPLTPARLESLAAEVTAAVNSQSDFRASAEYRSAMAGVLVRRALAAALRRAGRAH